MTSPTSSCRRPAELSHLLLARCSRLAFAGQVHGADLKIIVPAAPGGGWDQLGRAVAAVDAGGQARRPGAGQQCGRRRRHDRARAAHQQQQGRRQRADGHRQGNGVGDLHQQVAREPFQRHADREVERRIRSARRAGIVEPEDDGRPHGDVQGQSRLGVVGGRPCRRRRSAHGGDDHSGRRRRCRQVQLCRLRQRRRGAVADARRTRHRRHGRLQRVRLADHRGQAARARDHLRQATAGRQHPDAEGARDQRRVRQLARADGRARHQRSAAAGAHQDGHENGEVRAVESASSKRTAGSISSCRATSSRPMWNPSRRTC